MIGLTNKNVFKQMSMALLMISLVLTGLMSIGSTVHAATITAYPRPDLSSLSMLRPAYDFPSITVGGVSVPAYEFNNKGKAMSRSDPAYPNYNQSFNKVSFAEFSFTGGSVNIVINCNFAVNSFKILPADFGITGTKSGNTITIPLSSPKKIHDRIQWKHRLATDDFRGRSGSKSSESGYGGTVLLCGT